MNRVLPCLAFVVFAACHGETPARTTEFFSLTSTSIDGSPFALSSLISNRASVLVFLAPDCPLSQRYTRTLDGLRAQFEGDGARFYGLIAGDYFERKEVEDFVSQYRLNFTVLLDRNMELANLFGATRTPEVFVVDSHGKTLYRGSIDNYAPDFGQYRRVITENYLLEVLEMIAQGRDVPVKETQAVGCFIERKG